MADTDEIGSIPAMTTGNEIPNAIEKAEAEYREGKFNEARVSIGSALSQLLTANGAPADVRAEHLARIAKTLLQLSAESESDTDSEKAQLVIDLARGWYGDHSEVLIRQAWLFYSKLWYDKALAHFKQVLREQTGNWTEDDRIDALCGAGAAARELRQYDDAEAFLSQAPAELLSVLIERGWLRFNQTLYQSAIADFKKAETKLNGGDPEDALQVRLGLIACHQAEDSEEQVPSRDRGGELLKSWVKNGIVSEPQALTIAFRCGLVHADLNRYRGVLLACNLALEIDPESEKAWAAKIETLMWLRRYNEAEQTYLLAEAKFPESLKIWRKMAYAYYWQKRYAEALEYYSGAALQKREFASEEARSEFEKNLAADVTAAEWTIVQLRKMRRLAEAENQINKALIEFGPTAYLLDEKAAIYFSKQEFERAIDVFNQALLKDEYHAFPHQWRAASLRKLRRFDEAKRSLEKALKKLPWEAGLWEELAWLSFDQNDLKTANQHFEKAVALDPYLIQRQLSRVEVLARRNLNDEALEMFRKLQAEFPDDAEVREQLGWFYLRLGKLELAKDEFDAILRIDPENVLGINGLGGYYLEQRDYAGAEEYFRWAIETIKYEPQYHLNLAWSLVRQVREPGEAATPECLEREELLDQAIQQCREALRLDPHNAKAYLCLGVIAFRRKRYLDAESYFRRSLELNPADGAHVELGALYTQMGQYEDAARELQAALKMNSNDARAKIELANLLVLTDKASDAVRACRHAVSIEHHNADNHRALAVALMRAGHYDEAERVVRSALARLGPPPSWQLQLVLSQVLMRLGDDNNKDRDLYTEALKNINLAKQRESNADLYFYSGIIRYKLEDYRSARKDFNDCVRSNRERFEAERLGKLAQSMIKEARKVSRINTWGGMGISIFCGLMLIVVWSIYFAGWKRDVAGSGETAANSSRPTDATNAANGSAAATAASNSGQAEIAGKAPPNKQELVVDKSMLTVMTPLLLGLLVVGLVLPNLTKLKLFGGFEAEIAEIKTKEISSGPKGEIGLGSSLPIISPGPR